MAKLSLASLLSSFASKSLLNNNFKKIEDDLNDKVLYRDSPSGEPNQMENVLDMNSNRIINLPAPLSQTDALRLADIPVGEEQVSAVFVDVVDDDGVFDQSNVEGVLKELHDLFTNPEDATDSGTDVYVSESTTTTPVDTGVIARDFQSLNTTSTPTLDGISLTTRDGSSLWSSALNGIHLLQYNAGAARYEVLDPNPLDGDQPASIDYIRARSTEAKLPFENPTKHNAFAITDTLQDGTIVHFYREADEHGVSETGVMRFVKSLDGGLTWTAPVTILDEVDRDIRNYGGGVTDNDTIIVFTGATRTTGTDGSEFELRVLRSVDGGNTFSEQVVSESDVNNLSAYGKLVITSTSIIQTTYRTTSNAFVIFTSTDDGVTWSATVVTTSFPGSSIFTEATAVNIGSDRIICVARDNSADNAPALYTTSSDGGATWSSVVQLNHIPLGKNPPILWYNEDTEIISLVWPSRGSTRMSDGGSGVLWPFYVSYSDADTLWAATNGNSLRRPVAIQVFGPAFVDGNTGGDQGYQHLVKTKYGTQMIYYKGNADPTPETSFFRTNMEVVAGGLF